MRSISIINSIDMTNLAAIEFCSATCPAPVVDGSDVIVSNLKFDYPITFIGPNTITNLGSLRFSRVLTESNGLRVYAGTISSTLTDNRFITTITSTNSGNVNVASYENQKPKKNTILSISYKIYS